MKSLSEMNGFLKSSLEQLRKAYGAKNVVGARGSLEAKLCIVGESPSVQDDNEDFIFSDRSGDLLFKILKDCGLQEDDIYLTNCIKCRMEKVPAKKDIVFFKPSLWKELQTVKPKVIITLGGIASNLLLKKNESLCDLIGKKYKVDYMDSIIIPAWHPNYLLHNSANYTLENNKLFNIARKMVNGT